MYAAESGDFKIIEKLMSRRVDPNKYDKYGRTALIFACKNDHILAVETLLSYDIDALWKDYVGKMALDYAKSRTIKQLLKFYMVQKDQMTDALKKELDEEKYNIKKYLD
mmetsp:Transcript_11885/g.10252  ORF Transcript_11885/g.10252 Transcript_11885/m.10252 type:complete len:109 (-) Transcript_11885:55-381(-)|eukprot:CAMPEP_0114594422 /NCGR_PEP_ID=MMETSP0125-20121206/16078_1 /TAXON_ID=485358 ORGANISM="Aristerostoma sp., Strain ATCC 50986" /NCGR_SAMPLE_ID=MMETSP0125 /ASSEMBLY_ACC=CAM_ASM_000245 /LENGTH=108 /DNA_ID=CAMNT_0001794709 /DNA_START=387 /DNA_END=713 /DNA_ORIENTATION=+